MSWELSGYRRALDTFERALSGVAGDRWAAASPCAGWTARDVAGHVIGGQYLVTALADGSPCQGAPMDIATEPGRFCADDPMVAWAAARKAATDALTPEALRRPVPFGAFGELPLNDLLGGGILELLIHSWDLARATGQPVRLDADLVHHAFATAQVLAPSLRRAGHYATPIKPRPGADELARLLAFLGRTEG